MRKREQRARQAKAIHEKDSSFWTVAECMAVLNAPRLRGGALGKSAWLQLGKIRGFDHGMAG